MENKLVILVAAVGLVAAGNHDKYARSSVHGIKLRDSSDQELLSNLMVDLDLDIWQYGMPAEDDTLVMLTPDNRDIFLSTMDIEGIEHYVQYEDVAKFLEEGDERLFQFNARRSNGMIFEAYRRWAEIDQYMETVAAQYPDKVTIVTAGPTSQGRPVKYLKISTTNFEDPRKPVYFMDATMHAREWVTTPVALYSIYRLVENVRNGESDLINDIDWIILPLANPDGYEYTHTNDRLWRKTLSINPNNFTCIGVDSNRNFDVAFNTSGVSTDPCANTYPGWAPFSEPETRYVRDIMRQYVDRIQIYMNIHSHGNWLLYAYGDRSLPPNAFSLHHVGTAMGAAIDAVKRPDAQYYKVGNSAMLLYGSSGSAQDYGQLVGIPFSYTLELPGYTYGFQVPPEYIEQINMETWEGIVVSARLARAYYRLRNTTGPN